MKKAVIASLLAVAGAVPLAHRATAQTQVSLGSGQQAGGVQLAPAEYNDYTAAVAQTTPQAQAAAFEAFLTKYPQSQVKTDVLQRLMAAYSSFDPAKTIGAVNTAEPGSTMTPGAPTSRSISSK